MSYSARGMGRRGANRIHACHPFKGETRGERKHVFSARAVYCVKLKILHVNTVEALLNDTLVKRTALLNGRRLDKILF